MITSRESLSYYANKMPVKLRKAWNWTEYSHYYEWTSCVYKIAYTLWEHLPLPFKAYSTSNTFYITSKSIFKSQNQYISSKVHIKTCTNRYIYRICGHEHTCKSPSIAYEFHFINRRFPLDDQVFSTSPSAFRMETNAQNCIQLLSSVLNIMSANRVSWKEWSKERRRGFGYEYDGR